MKDEFSLKLGRFYDDDKILQHEGCCDDWDCAEEKALEYLEKTGYNTYPKKRSV